MVYMPMYSENEAEQSLGQGDKEQGLTAPDLKHLFQVLDAGDQPISAEPLFEECIK